MNTPLDFDDRLVLAQTSAALAFVRHGGELRLSQLLDIAEQHSVEASCFDGVRGRSDFHRMAEELQAWARSVTGDELVARATH